MTSKPPPSNRAQIASAVIAVLAAGTAVVSCQQTREYYAEATRKLSHETQISLLERLRRTLETEDAEAMNWVALRRYATANRVELRKVANELRRREMEGGVNDPVFQESLAALGATLRAQLKPGSFQHCRELNAALLDVEQALESGTVTAQFVDDRLHEELVRFSSESWLYCAIALDSQKAGPAAVAYFYFGATNDDCLRAVSPANPAGRWASLRFLEITPLRTRSRNELQRLTPQGISHVEWLGCSGAVGALKASSDFAAGEFSFSFTPAWSRPDSFLPCAYLGSKPRAERLRLWGQVVTKSREPPELGEWVTVDFGPDGTAIATLGLDDQRIRAEVVGELIHWEPSVPRLVRVEWNSLALSPEDALTLTVSGVADAGMGTNHVPEDFALQPKSP